MLSSDAAWGLTLLLRTYAFMVCISISAEGSDDVKLVGASDPAALSILQEWSDTFGGDIYHCAWEYEAERMGGHKFGNGSNKMRIDGEWSFSTKLGSSYKLRCEGVEYIVREIQDTKGTILSFWPDLQPDGQKYRMNYGFTYYDAIPREVGAVIGLLYPCGLRSLIRQDRLGNPNIFGVHKLEAESIILSIEPSRKEFDRQLVLATRSSIQAIAESWKVTNHDNNMYQIYAGAEYEKSYTNVKVKDAWLPSSVSYVKRTASGLLGGKAILETAKWRMVGEYRVDRDISCYEKIVPPQGTLLTDELTRATQRIGGGVGTWRTSNAERKAPDNALVKELMQLPDTPATVPLAWYPTGRTNIYLVIGVVLLVLGGILVFIKTKRTGASR